MRKSSLLIFGALLPLVLAALPTPTLETRSGWVSGFIADGGIVEVFRGIPFAQPPTGDRRWRAPERESSWGDGMRMATQFGHACMQKPNSFTEIYPVTTSEDCLYLNVYRKSSRSSQSLPVMIFFHGGSYVLGASSFLIYDATQLVSAAAADDEVIVVTANYRLQVFGFLGGERMRDPGAFDGSGNWGLLDQRAAMQWVHENAAHLGADPSRVTIFGESAGAGSVSNHLISSRSWPYFNAAIMQSGPVNAQWITLPLKDAELSLSTVMKNANCTTVEELRMKNRDVILKAGETGIVDHDQIDWAPVVDGVAILDTPATLLGRGHVHRVPVLLGTNKNEGTEFTSKSISDLPSYKKYLLGKFGTKVAPLVQAMYPIAEYASPFLAASAVEGGKLHFYPLMMTIDQNDFFSDYSMSCPARETARMLSSNASSPVYLYYFTRELELVKLAKSNLGVFHGSELVFVFSTLTALLGPAEKELSAAFGKWWRSFAAHGSPGSDWKPYSSASDALLNISTPPGMVSATKKTLCDFWHNTSVPPQAWRARRARDGDSLSLFPFPKH